MTILYTPIPIENIFNTENTKPQHQEMEIGESKKLILERISDNQCQVVRLISTDCNDFLNPKYQPGTLINLYYM